MCTQAERANKEPQAHECYKNWDGPSLSMETDILVEGFKRAETQHGLRYTTFIQSFRTRTGSQCTPVQFYFYRKLVFPVQNANIRFTLTSSYSNMTISRQLTATKR